MRNPNDETLRKKRQRMRSIAIAVSLGVLCVLFFLVTIVRFGSHTPIHP
jgi:uncharacterized membrane protein YgaE (UPF0421/DUF939 family)